MKRTKTWAGTLLALFLATGAGAQEYNRRIAMEGVDMMGSVVAGMIDKQTRMERGFYRFDYDRAFDPDKYNPVFKALVDGGCVLHDGKIYANEYDNDYRVHEQKPHWRVYDAKTFELLSDHELPDNCRATTLTLAYNQADDKIYGIGDTYDHYFFVRIDPETGAMEEIGDHHDHNTVFHSVVWTPQDGLLCLYMDRATSSYSLGRIRTRDGKLAKLGDLKVTGLPGTDPYTNDGMAQAMFYNNATRKIYWTFGSASEELGLESCQIMAEVDPTTCTATMVAYAPTQCNVSGQFFLEPPFEAPAIIEGFEFVPSAVGSLSGRLRITLPAVSYVGEALTGDLRVRVEHDGETLVETTAASGSVFTTDELTFANGMQTLQITIGNDAGDGPTVKREFFAGFDRPKACQNIRLTADGLTTTLTWDAPVEGVEGAVINPDEYTYKVWRYPGELLVSEGRKDRRLVETHPAELTRYVYRVVAVEASGREGVTALSNNLIVGTPLDPPYGGPFETPESLYNRYTILDSNGDGSTWNYVEAMRAAYYEHHPLNQGDDWLIAPPLNYKAGSKYTLSFMAVSMNSGYPEDMIVTFGDGRTPEAQSQVLLELYEIPAVGEDVSAQEYSVDFTVPADGVYYYGFHVVSPAFHDKLVLTNVYLAVEHPQSGVERPEADSPVTVTADGGRLRVDNPQGLAVTVCDLNGRTICRVQQQAVELPLPAGVYLVQAGGLTQKAVVR